MPNATPIYLIDVNGVAWQLATTDGGLVNLAEQLPVPPPGSVHSIQIEDTNLGQLWNLTILLDIFGNPSLHVDPILGANTLTAIPVNSPNGSLWGIQFTAGIMNTLLLVVPGGVATNALTQVDTWELDNFDGNWPGNSATPISWWENTLPQQELALALTPSTNGTIGLLYVALAATLTGAGVNLAVPDDWTPYIYWGTLAELLSSDGPAFDPIRANYCKQRYQEGVELARLVLGGP